MNNQLFSELQITKENKSVRIEMNENKDFSIHDIKLVKGKIENLYLKIHFTSNFNNIDASKLFNLVDYFKENNYPLIDKNNNPIYIRTVKNTTITINFESSDINDIFEINANYMFK